MRDYALGEGPYGSAYRGTIDDLFASRDLATLDVSQRRFGLFLGHFDWSQTFSYTWTVPRKGLLAWWNGDKTRKYHDETLEQTLDLRFTGDSHHLVVASSGAGKFRDVLANMLLYDGSCETACLIVDPKGEIAATIGPYLDGPEAADPRTVILDPWNLCGTGITHALTLLEGLREDNPRAVKDARVLADALIVERSSEEGHWVTTAKNFLSALLLYIGADTENLKDGDRTLIRLREIVTLPWSTPEEEEASLTTVLVTMSLSELFSGIIARAAQAMLNREEKERRLILSTLERETAFIDDPHLWEALRSSSFDIDAFVRTNKRLHIIVPFDYTKEMRSWIRLTIASFYNACLRNSLDSALPSYLRFRHIIIDEFAGLGKMDFIIKDIAEARGAGIKYHLFVQDFGQLHHHYGHGWESIVANSMIQAFGINDIFTSEYLSKLTGQATVITRSEAITESSSATTGTSQSTSRSTPSGSLQQSSTEGYSASESTTRGWSKTVTIATTGRSVLMPDEVRRLPSDRQLLFLRGMPVIMARRTPYFRVFSSFKPLHSLADVLRHSAPVLPRPSHSLVALGIGHFGKPLPLHEVNSRLLLPTFVSPSYRGYSFKEALWHTLLKPTVWIPIVVIAAWSIFSVIHTIQERQEAARREAELADKRKQEEEAARKAALIKQQQEQERARIDKIIASQYASMFEVIYSEIVRLRLCPEKMSPFQCRENAFDPNGSTRRIGFIWKNFLGSQWATFSMEPKNVTNGAAFSGVQITYKIQTGDERLSLRKIEDAPKSLLSTILLRTGVDPRLLTDCWSGKEGLTQKLDRTIFNCSVNENPQSGINSTADLVVNIRLVLD